MNDAPKVEAFKTYYSEGIEFYKMGDIANARASLLRAAELAAEIAKGAKSIQVHDDFQSRAGQIVDFVQKRCSGKKPAPPATAGSDKVDEDEISFKPVDLSANGKKITFEDVAGLKEVKDEIIFNVMKPLENPELAKIYKVNPGAKIILYGPPGTGKTFIAKAIASELNAAFYSINCSDLVSKFMGDSSKRVDALFRDAQRNKRAAIFFDEFDSLATKREDTGGSLDSERNAIVSSLLTSIDGFKKSQDCEMLLLIAATNRPWAIDSALLRGGRFSTHIYVDLPDNEARMFLLNKEFSSVPMDANVLLTDLSSLLDGYGCGDIVDICQKIRNQAYRRAIKYNAVVNVSLEDVRTVLSNAHPSSTPEAIEKFHDFKNGISVE